MVCVSIIMIFDLLNISLSLSENDLSLGNFWTGLTKPDNVGTCSNNDCINKLVWDSDGSSLTSWVDQSHQKKADLIGVKGCFIYRNNELNDKTCSNIIHYICEFKC